MHNTRRRNLDRQYLRHLTHALAGSLDGQGNGAPERLLSCVSRVDRAGYLLDATHSWSSVFGIAACIYSLGYAGFAVWGSAKKQFD